MKKVVIAGGTGFVGSILAEHYVQKGYEVVVLSRRHHLDKDGIRFVQWDGKNYGSWNQELEATEILINMNGKSVDCRYNEGNKQEIYASRIDSTYILGQAIEVLDNPPKLWINSSSATIYRHAEDRQMDEATGELGTGFSVDVCKKWEQAFFETKTKGTRKVALRMAIVLGKHGGALQPLVQLTKLGLGGKQGNGEQFFSWVHEEDLLRAVDFIQENKEMEGPINIAAPAPVKNCLVMKMLRNATRIPVGLPAPKWLLEIGAVLIQTETELILKSRNVIPGKLTKMGFDFQFPTLELAIKDLV